MRCEEPHDTSSGAGGDGDGLRPAAGRELLGASDDAHPADHPRAARHVSLACLPDDATRFLIGTDEGAVLSFGDGRRARRRRL